MTTRLPDHRTTSEGDQRPTCILTRECTLNARAAFPEHGPADRPGDHACGGCDRRVVYHPADLPFAVPSDRPRGSQPARFAPAPAHPERPELARPRDARHARERG